MLRLKALGLAVLVALVCLYPLFYSCLFLGIFSMHGDGHIEVFFVLEVLSFIAGYMISYRWLKKRS